jgi:phosphatidylcholine synthase
MAGSVIIDAVDGTIARRAQVKVYAPQINGELLDNLIDFLNYVVVPAVFLLVSDMLPLRTDFIAASMIVFVSAFQFSQHDAKTRDHFFKGFPSYWNIVVCYLFLARADGWFSFILITIFSLLSFVPIKYLYPSRLDYFSNSAPVRSLVLLATIAWGIVTMALIWLYPKSNDLLLGIALAYLAAYFVMSLYRTIRPIDEHEGN